MKFKSLFAFLLLMPFYLFAEAPESTPNNANPDQSSHFIQKTLPAKESFLKGVQLYGEKDFKGAQEYFLMSYEKEPENALTLYNLGLSSHQLKEIGLTLGAWRKALHLDYSLKNLLSSYFKLEKQIQIQTSQKSSLWSDFRELVLIRMNIDLVLGLLFLSLFVFLFYLIRFLGQRKKAIINETPLPKITYLSSFAFFGILFFGALVICSSYDYLNPRATALKSIEIKTSPNEDSSVLFKVTEGQDLLLKKLSSNWVQIESLSGSKGWVLKENLFYVSGRKLW